MHRCTQFHTIFANQRIVITALYHLKTKKTELLFQKKKAYVKGKDISKVTGELTALVGDDLQWKLTLGHNATTQ